MTRPTIVSAPLEERVAFIREHQREAEKKRIKGLLIDRIERAMSSTMFEQYYETAKNDEDVPLLFTVETCEELFAEAIAELQAQWPLVK